MRRLIFLEHLLLIPIVCFACFVAFIPHSASPYPVHLDEWSQVAFSNQIVEQGGVEGLANPFSGGAPSINQYYEVGSHLFWAVLRQVSGIDWLVIVRYFPSVIFALTVLSVYALARRQGFGLEAALFVCLMPTTVGILGPGFLVPVALALPFVVLSIFLALNFRTWPSYLLLFIVVSSLFAVHAVSAVGLIVILAPYILLSLRHYPKHALSIGVTMTIPLIMAWIWAPGTALSMARQLTSQSPLIPYVDVPWIIATYGYLPVSFCLLGSAMLAAKGGRPNYGLVLGLLGILAVLFSFFTFHYGLVFLYYRGLTLAMLMMSVVAGAGLWAVMNLRLPVGPDTNAKSSVMAGNVGNMVGVILIGVTLAIAIPARLNTPYYHMIDSTDYQAFVWIRQNLGNSSDRLLLDPWKGAAAVALTGNHVFSAIGEAPTARDEQAYKFLEQGCPDTQFLLDNHISIVYTRVESANPDLAKIRDYVYLVRPIPAGK